MICNTTNPESLGEVAVHKLLRKTVCLQGLMREYTGSLLKLQKETFIDLKFQKETFIDLKLSL